MNTAAWAIQGILAVIMLFTGFMKLSRPKDSLKDQMAYVEDFSQGFIRFIGAAELLGGLGLILPMLTGILPILTPLAAVGLLIIQSGALYTHVRRSEGQMLLVNLALMLGLAFIIYARFFAIPVA